MIVTKKYDNSWKKRANPKASFPLLLVFLIGKIYLSKYKKAPNAVTNLKTRLVFKYDDFYLLSTIELLISMYFSLCFKNTSNNFGSNCVPELSSIILKASSGDIASL